MMVNDNKLNLDQLTKQTGFLPDSSISPKLISLEVH